MSEFEVVLSMDATRDLRGIYEYIAQVLGEPVIAENQYHRILLAAHKLSTMPERNPLFPDEPWHGLGLRKLLVDHFIAAYLIDTKAKTVTIIRVFYAKRDIRKLLIF